VRRFEILLEMLNRKDLQDLKEQSRSILSSRSLRSSWFIILVLTATSSSSDGTAELFRVSPPEAVVYLNGINGLPVAGNPTGRRIRQLACTHGET